MGAVRRLYYKRERFESYYYKHAKQKKYKRFECMRIIKGVNDLAMKYIYKGGEFEFPSKLGSLSIVGLHYTHHYNHGRLMPVKPIDWGATRKLWEEDEDARNKKQLVRFTNDYVYKFQYKRNPYGIVQCWPMKIQAFPFRKKELCSLIRANKLFVQTKDF